MIIYVECVNKAYNFKPEVTIITFYSENNNNKKYQKVIRYKNRLFFDSLTINYDDNENPERAILNTFYYNKYRTEIFYDLENINYLEKESYNDKIKPYNKIYFKEKH